MWHTYKVPRKREAIFVASAEDALAYTATGTGGSENSTGCGIAEFLSMIAMFEQFPSQESRSIFKKKTSH